MQSISFPLSQYCQGVLGQYLGTPYLVQLVDGPQRLAKAAEVSVEELESQMNRPTRRRDGQTCPGPDSPIHRMGRYLT